MKLFELNRELDETGISGTGIVAQGVIFDSGQCVMTWLTEHTSVAIYASIEDVIAIHGHDGKTKVVVRADIDLDVARKAHACMVLDECEGVHNDFTEERGKNYAYMWEQRERLASMFKPVVLNPSKGVE